MCFAPDKKIPCTFEPEVRWYFYVPERESARERKIERRKKVWAIIFLNPSGQNEKSANYI
jgi:hypothetical protein